MTVCVEGEWERVCRGRAHAANQHHRAACSTAVVDVRKLRPLTADFFEVAPPLAVEMVLAFVKPPSEEQVHYHDCAAWFQEISYGQTLRAQPYYREEGRLAVVLEATGEAGEVINVNASMVEYGLCRALRRKAGSGTGKCPRELEPAPLLEKLDSLQAQAKTGRTGMWRYGDADSDDEGA